jgi:hypothetical protein
MNFINNHEQGNYAIFRMNRRKVKICYNPTFLIMQLFFRKFKSEISIEHNIQRHGPPWDECIVQI